MVQELLQLINGDGTWTADKDYPILYVVTYKNPFNSSTDTYPLLSINSSSQSGHDAGWLILDKTATLFYVIPDVKMGDVFSVPDDSCCLFVRTSESFN